MKRLICSSLILSLLASALICIIPVSAAPSGTAVRNEAEFLAMSADGSYYLANDITLYRSYSGSFSGVFDGNGHTVTSSVPLFNSLSGATVRNLDLKASSKSDSSKDMAALALKANGTFENISAAVDFEVSAKADYFQNSIGGIISEINGASILRSCEVSGSAAVLASADWGTGISSALGGIAGRVSNAGEVRFISCTNSARIENSQMQISVGGILGITRLSSEVTFTECVNKGEVYGRGGQHSGMAGICGTADGTHSPDAKVRFEQCRNIAAISERIDPKTKDNLHIGGILGRGYGIASAEFESCLNFGEILSAGGGWASSGGIAGGIMTYGFAWSGTHAGVINFSNCANLGKISGGFYSGGIIGGALQFNTDGCMVTVDKCANYAEISGGHAGGIIGHCGESAFNGLLVNDCYNGGTISGSSACAGIVGSINTASNGGEYAITVDLGRSISSCINAGLMGEKRSSSGIIDVMSLQKVTVSRCINIPRIDGAFFAVSSIANKNIEFSGNYYVGEAGEHSYGTAISESYAQSRADMLLSKLPADTSELIRWCNIIKAYTASGYSSGWEDFAKARERTEELVYSFCTYDEAKAAETALLNALDNLTVAEEIDNSLLIDALSVAENLMDKKDEYTKNSFEALEKVYFEAVYKRYSADPTEIKTTARALIRAFEDLEERGNIENLREVLEKYADYRREEFTEYGWSQFHEAFVSAAEINDPQNASREEIREAISRLEAAAELLERRADPTEVLREIEELADYYKKDSYTLSSYNEFLLHIEAAKKELLEDDLSKSYIEELRGKISLTPSLLVKRGDLGKLDPLLEEVFFCKSRDYTSGAWETLVDLLKEIEGAREENIAAELSEEDVNELCERLRAAIDDKQEQDNGGEGEADATDTTEKSTDVSPAEQGCGGAVSGFALIFCLVTIATLAVGFRKEN